MRIPNAKRLKDCFLMTPEMWQAIYDYQKGLCGVCGKPLDRLNAKGNPTPIHVDHRHTDGLIRGLACFRCNAALGEMMTIEFLTLALNYLTHPPATAALGYAHKGLPGRTGTKRQRKLAKQMAAHVESRPLAKDFIDKMNDTTKKYYKKMGLRGI